MSSHYFSEPSKKTFEITDKRISIHSDKFRLLGRGAFLPALKHFLENIEVPCYNMPEDNMRLTH